MKDEVFIFWSRLSYHLLVNRSIFLALFLLTMWDRRPLTDPQVCRWRSHWCLEHALINNHYIVGLPIDHDEVFWMGLCPLWLTYHSLLDVMNFSIVILNEFVACYSQMQWVEWKDHVRKQMMSEGDHWSMTTLSGSTIWDCLDRHKIDRAHLVQWKPVSDTIYQVSLPRK